MRKGRRVVVAAGAAAILAAGGWWMLHSRPSKPTPATTGPGRLELIAPGVSIWTIIEPPTGKGNAADDYQKGVVELHSRGMYEKVMQWASAGSRRGAFPSRVADYLHAGAAKAEMRFFGALVLPADAVGKRALAVLEDLARMARIARCRVEYDLAKGRTEQAESLCRDLLVFGHHVMSERVRVAGIRVGLSIQQAAAELLACLYERRGDAEAASRVRAYLDGLREAQGKLDRKARETIGRERPELGDLLLMARQDADRAWRIEAMLRLAECVDGALRRADRRAIRKLLEEVAAGSDPFLRAAGARLAEALERRTRGG